MTEGEDVLQRSAERMQRAIRAGFARMSHGEAAEGLLQGRWLGHPLHPVLTDAVTGGLTMAVVLDGVDATGLARVGKAADICLAFGRSGRCRPPWRELPTGSTPTDPRRRSACSMQ